MGPFYSVLLCVNTIMIHKHQYVHSPTNIYFLLSMLCPRTGGRSIVPFVNGGIENFEFVAVSVQGTQNSRGGREAVGWEVRTCLMQLPTLNLSITVTRSNFPSCMTEKKVGPMTWTFSANFTQNFLIALPWIQGWHIEG